MNRAELEQRLRERIRMQGKSRKTANTYSHWIRRYLEFNRSKGTGKETQAERAVEAFLSHLANREHVSANTQNQAFSALCYLYRHVFERPLEDVSALRSKRPNRTREVCDQSELVEIFRHLSGFPLLACQLMYGCGLRIGEAVSLRLKDLHFERRQMHVWDGKGKKDRMVQLPECLHDDLRRQVERVRLVWEDDRQNNRPGVPLPGAFGRKSPRSHRELGWYWLFPADGYSTDPDTGRMWRWHRDASGISKALSRAVQRSGVTKRITAHSLRHGWATHSMEGGVPLHTVKELLGHVSIETTELYLHVTQDGVTAARSPIESMGLADVLANPVRREQNRPRLRVFAG